MRKLFLSIASFLMTSAALGATVNSSITGTPGASQQVDSNGNPIVGPQQVQQLDGLTLSGTGAALNDYVIGGSQGQDTTGYNSFVVQNLSIGTGNTVVCEWSSNRTNFQGLPMWSLSSTQLQSIYSASGAMTAANVYASPVYLQYVRCRVSVYSSGTWQSNAILRNTPFNLSAQQFNVVGTAAKGTAASGNPLQDGCVVQTSVDTSLTTNNWMAPCIADKSGAQVVMPFASGTNTWKYTSASGGITTATTVTINAAQASNVRGCMADLSILNVGTAGTEVKINDGHNGTALWDGYAAPNVPVQATFAVGRCGTAATLMEVQTVSGTNIAVYVNIDGYNTP